MYTYTIWCIIHHFQCFNMDCISCLYKYILHFILVYSHLYSFISSLDVDLYLSTSPERDKLATYKLWIWKWNSKFYFPKMNKHFSTLIKYQNSVLTSRSGNVQTINEAQARLVLVFTNEMSTPPMRSRPEKGGSAVCQSSVSCSTSFSFSSFCSLKHQGGARHEWWKKIYILPIDGSQNWSCGH